MSSTSDVVVVGGGPAGLGVAGALALRGRSVTLFERSGYEGWRVGETLGGEIRPLLEALGAADVARDLLSDDVPCLAIRSAWGSARLEERPSIVDPFGHAFHVDRARFDSRLAAWAERAGVSVRRGSGRCAVARVGDDFQVAPAHGEVARARFLVDASGRGAPAGRALRGRRWLAWDRQVALIARMGASPARELAPELLLEAAPDGWWYSVPQPDAALVVAWVTDVDSVRASAASSRRDRFSEALARTTHTAARARGLSHEGTRVARADSGCLLPAAGPGWRAVGDAAMATDPLSGDGVVRALRSAVAAAARIDLELSGSRGVDPPDPPERLFASYLQRRAEVYSQEARWSDHPFWARRRSIPWEREPLKLDPRAVLCARRARGDIDLARVESLLPARAIADLLEALREPQPAHVAMTCLRRSAPLGDRRLLVGLALLVERGAIDRL